MRAKKLCHKLLLSASLHEKRRELVSEVVETALGCKQLSITKLGQKMKNGRQSRSNIRKMDRCYSNPHLYHERLDIYRTMAAWLVKSPSPFIVVDGSKLPRGNYFTLRASLIAQGRALTLYECVFEQKEYGSLKLYKRFLSDLKSILPVGTTPILITDAEFRAPWFKTIVQMGWDFIGRIRGNTYCALGHEDFEPCKDIMDIARAQPRMLGQGSITQKDDCDGYFYLHQRPPKGRHAYTRSGQKNKTIYSQQQSLAAQEPWLLFSSLNETSHKVIKAYEYRMTIEENFRDMKSRRYGLGLEMTFATSKQRYAIIMLIAMLVTTIAYLVGTLAELKQWQYQFQAASTKHKRLLSRFFLGAEVFYKQLHFSFKELIKVIYHLQEEIYAAFR